MRASERDEQAELTDYVGVLSRRWWIIAGLTLVGLAASVAYILLAPKSYTATAGVEVNPTAVNNAQQQAGAAKTAVNMDNESQLVQSATVATLAARLLHSPLTPAELAKHISVAIPPNSQLLEISCTASSAADSATCANAVAEAYLQHRTATATSQINSEIAQLNTEAKGLLSQIAALKIKMNSLPPNDPTTAGDAALSAEDTAKLHTLASQEAVLQAELSSMPVMSRPRRLRRPHQAAPPRTSYCRAERSWVSCSACCSRSSSTGAKHKLIRSDSYLDRQLDLPVLLSMPQLKLKPQLGLASSRSRAGRAWDKNLPTR